ncbi:MAG: hypothetical protein SFX72_01470 [Isosphaeraceae bacterium]|nr:hypothetical protein [Isosphaeraceae bacterium]
MKPTWTQRGLAALACTFALLFAACGSETTSEGNLPQTKPATSESVKADIEKFKATMPGAYKGRPGGPPAPK